MKQTMFQSLKSIKTLEVQTDPFEAEEEEDRIEVVKAAATTEEDTTLISTGIEIEITKVEEEEITRVEVIEITIQEAQEEEVGEVIRRLLEMITEKKTIPTKRSHKLTSREEEAACKRGSMRF